MINHYAQGGLGNQLFNYAAARSLADRVGADLLIDVESYRDQWSPDARRPFLINRFPVRAKFRNMGHKREQKPLLARIYRRLSEDFFSAIVERPAYDIAYFSGFEKLGRYAVLKGHFIDYRFFDWNKERLFEDLNLTKDILDGDVRSVKLFASIQSAECPIAIHVRRGDLLDENNRWLLLDGMERYYKNAMNDMQARYPSANYFVFSDDPDWCLKQFTGGRFNITIVEPGGNPVKDILSDFFLMRTCKHNVIANNAF